MNAELSPARLQAALFATRQALLRVFPEMDHSECPAVLAMLLGGAMAEVTPRTIPAVQLEVLLTQLVWTARATTLLFWEIEANDA